MKCATERAVVPELAHERDAVAPPLHVRVGLHHHDFASLGSLGEHGAPLGSGAARYTDC